MLTKREAQVLQFIADHLRRTGGVSPSYDEVAAGIGVKAKSHIANIVNSLVAKGRLHHLPKKQRSFTVVVEHVGYFRFDDEEKRLVPLCPESSSSTLMGR